MGCDFGENAIVDWRWFAAGHQLKLLGGGTQLIEGNQSGATSWSWWAADDTARAGDPAGLVGLPAHATQERNPTRSAGWIQRGDIL